MTTNMGVCERERERERERVRERERNGWKEGRTGSLWVKKGERLR